MKVWIFLAPFVVLAAVVLVSGWVGSKVGRAREAALRQGIDPKWATAAEEFVRECVQPPTDLTAIHDMVVIPAKLRARGQQILFTAPGAAARRERRSL